MGIARAQLNGAGAELKEEREMVEQMKEAVEEAERMLEAMQKEVVDARHEMKGLRKRIMVVDEAKALSK